MNWNTDNIGDQSHKFYIVTGANSGIGFEAAKSLADNGAHVVLACRNIEKAKSAKNAILQHNPPSKIEILLLDLANLASLTAFADEYRQKFGKLDVLINNAGVMTPPFGKTMDGFELQFGSNHLGHFALTAQLIDLINASDQGRIVNLSSLAHKQGILDFNNLNAENGYSAYKAYAQSKLANLLFTYELKRRLEKNGEATKILAAHPGWTATNLQKTAPIFKFLNPLLSQSQTDGALPTLRAATDPNAESGSYWGPSRLWELRGYPKQVSSSEGSHDEEVALRLWNESELLTGVKFQI